MQNPFQQTHFLLSAQALRHAPPDSGGEVAFAGRSNAGKSSVINTITGIKGLARTSKTPGRTQHLNFFAVDGEERRLVDLPGYGFAKAPVAVQRRWEQTMDAYLRSRESLRGLILVMDVRRPLTEFDQAMLTWCGQAELPVYALLTKADKLKRGPASASLLRVLDRLGQEWPGAEAQLFSSLKKTGVDAARARLMQWLGAEGM